MDKPLKLYEVSRFSGYKEHIYAKDSGQAKRAYCRERGLCFNDSCCGASTINARAMKPSEAAEWEAQADAERATLLFIKGMLDIHAKAYADTHPSPPAAVVNSDERWKENDKN